MGSVLLIDDNSEITSLIVRMFKLNDLQVFSALNGEEALSLFDTPSVKDSDPRICVIDVVLPGEHGPKLMKRITELFPAIRFIIISGYPGIPEIDEMQKVGVMDTLFKPFKVEELVAKVQFIFSNSERVSAS